VIKLFSSFAICGQKRQKNTIRAVVIKDKIAVIEEKIRQDKLNKLKSHLQQQHNAITVATTPNEANVHASLAISKITEKKSKPSKRMANIHM
jgi:hypothetical protein